MVRFGLPLAVSGLGLWMMNVGDRLVVGHYLTPAALGRYTAVYTFASLMLALNAPLNLPLYPMLMNAVASNDSSALAGYVRRFHRYATLALVPAAVGLIRCLAGELMTRLTSPVAVAPVTNVRQEILS